MVWDRCKEASGFARSAPRFQPIEAPEDCRGSNGLCWLLDEGRRQLRGPSKVLTIDLSQVRCMNSGLLATVLLLVRESARAGRRLYLVGASDEFRNWARTFSLLETLEERGLMLSSGGRAHPVSAMA